MPNRARSSASQTATRSCSPRSFVRQTVAGKSFIGYGYNGQVPGPVIWAPKDAKVLVKYRNRIEWPNTVHWHGIRLENRFDGVEGTTQRAVPPNGDFDYVVHFRDAGLYWYHPHMREDILKDLGLYGNLMVRAAARRIQPRQSGRDPDAR